MATIGCLKLSKSLDRFSVFLSIFWTRSWKQTDTDLSKDADASCILSAPSSRLDPYRSCWRKALKDCTVAVSSGKGIYRDASVN